MMQRVVETANAAAWAVGVSATTIRDWQRRGLVGRVCDAGGGVVGYDVAECVRVRDSLAKTRPRGNRQPIRHDHEVECTADRCKSWAVQSAPVPLCLRHLQEVWLFGQEVLTQEIDWQKVADGGRRKPQIYFLRRGDLVKIGYTVDLPARLGALQAVGNDVLLTLPGGRAEERALHEVFKAQRVRGEWFTADGDLMNFIAQHANVDAA